jgi:hypothetical protein
MARRLMRAWGRVRFDAWIDQRHRPRKITTEAALGPERNTLTVLYTAINQQVTIALPPASQVAVVPPTVLRGTGGQARLGAA